MDQYDFDASDGRMAKTQKEILESLAAMPDFASLINLSAYEHPKGPYENGLCEDARDLTKGRHSNASLMMKLPYFAAGGYGGGKPEKNKKCQVCGKHARTPSDLLRHMRVHTGERPFPCVACTKTFKCKRSQLTHQYLSHGIRDGLSDHRLNVLDQRKTRKPPKQQHKDSSSSFLAQMPPGLLQLNQYMLQSQQQQEPLAPPPPQDQDEDTEIMAEEEISCSNDGPVSFVGLFNPTSDQGRLSHPLTDDSQQHEMDPRTADFSMGKSARDHQGGRTDQGKVVQDGGGGGTKSGRKEGGSTTVAELLQKKRKDRSKKVPVLRIKTHKCTHCRRQFRSIYTLRYHLRSMHDEKVYLSPALETRLKKRRWIPPHVRLQKSKLQHHPHSKKARHHHQKAHGKANFPALPTYPNEEIEQKFYAQAAQNFADAMPQPSKRGDALDLHVNAIQIKKEKMESYEEEINNNINLKNAENLRNLLGMSEKEMKQFPYLASTQMDTAASTAGTFSLNTSTNSNNSNPFMLPPHIFFPSSPNGEEALLNEKPISWESLQVTAESVLIVKIEAVHPATQQKYVLYKCGLCGKAYASLRVICGHLTLHTTSSKEKDCEKCGASFKWRTELDSHMECHQASDRKFLSSQVLPSYYVNPFPIPVVTPSEQNVLNSTRLLPYPFFPMPQQMPPLMQPGFFPFFATTTLQTQTQPSSMASEETPHNASNSVLEHGSTEAQEDKNAMQGCNFQCKMCPKTFDRIFSLQRHERIHSGVKACFCKICGRGFSELRNLRHHIIRFHADSTQKEPLPYRRRPNRVRNVSSSQKLVTFLKKTAVRILNSMGHNKLDPPSPLAEKENPVKPENEDAQPSSADEPQNLSTAVVNSEAVNAEEKCGASTMPKLFDATSQITELSPTQDLNEVLPPKLSPGVVTDARESSPTKGGAVEVLQDPKRSLLGNRRKGRPFKLTSSSHVQNMGVEDMLFPFSDSSFLAKHAAAITESSLLQATEFLNGCLKQEIAFPQLSFFNMNMQQGLPNLGLQESLANSEEREHSQNSQTSDEEAVTTDLQDPIPNEPLDMSNPVAKEKAKTPPHSQQPELTDNQAKSILVHQDPKNRSVPNSASFKLPESFESQCMFPCSYCHKSFNSIADINRHMSFHADIRPFKCPYCNYCSRTNSQLKVHMMRHEGIKHYMCQVCNYNGVTQSDLNRHLKTRTHLLRSRNVCSCCGTGFHTRSLSEEHYKSCILSGNNKNSQDQSPKTPQETSAATVTTTTAPSNRNRVTRLKQFRAPDDKIKNEFYQKLCDINSMGVTFGDFLQQSAAASSIKVEK